jgi:hypothetical protein
VRNAILGELPPRGVVVRAGFDFYFAGQSRPRRVEVRSPNTLKLPRNCDARVVHEWLSARGLRGRAQCKAESGKQIAESSHSSAE